MEQDVLHMISRMLEYEDHSLGLTITTAGYPGRNVEMYEQYTCLADYWKIRLACEEEL